MIYVYVALLMIGVSQLSFSQITTTKAPTKQRLSTNEPYDSLKNFLGEEPNKYIGQTLYLKGVQKNNQEQGYSGFVLDYKYNEYPTSLNVYKHDGKSYSDKSRYEDLANKYYSVISVHRHPEAEESKYAYGDVFFLKICEKESRDTMYYEYNSKYESSFPFITLGFFEKTKKEAQGKKFVFTKVVIANRLDINTGDTIKYVPNQAWECIDLTIDEQNYQLSLVLKIV